MKFVTLGMRSYVYVVSLKSSEDLKDFHEIWYKLCQ
jgi:hypothetical protein